MPAIAPSATPNAERFRIVAYVVDGTLPPSLIRFDSLTHINYAFLLPEPDGTLGNVKNPGMLKDIVTAAHAHGVKVLISVGGWGLDNAFEQLAAAPEARATFVDGLDQFVQLYQLDGADIDWEYPGPSEASSENFNTLMQALDERLRGQGKLLTAAVAEAGDVAEGIPSAVFDRVDFLNLMAYDGPKEAHSTYAAAVSSLVYWSGRGLPADKTVLGLPFYSRPNEVPYHQLVKADPAAASLDQFKYAGSVESYNGLPTTVQKTELALERASGVMFWTLAFDTQDKASLLDAIYRTAHAGP